MFRVGIRTFASKIILRRRSFILSVVNYKIGLLCVTSNALSFSYVLVYIMYDYCGTLLKKVHYI